MDTFFCFDYDNRIRHLEPLAGIQKLEALDLSGNKITKIDALKHLNHLKKLHLEENKIKDFTPIAHYLFYDKLKNSKLFKPH